MKKQISHEHYVALLCIGLITILAGYMAFNRTYLTFETETDFIGSFIPEAQRFIDGQPLSLEFHPPLYSTILGVVQKQTKNWMVSGIIISLVSSMLVLVTNYLLFYKICGRSAAWGTLLCFAASTTFISFSCFATSDMFFMAIYSSVLLLLYLAVTVGKNKWLWMLCGIVSSFALLTRSNSLTLLGILAVPWIFQCSKSRAFKNFIFVMVGISGPIFIWVIIAVTTGSPIAPSGNHTNLALTYFSETSDRMSGDARVKIEERFHSLKEVLTYNPTLMVKTYLKDFYFLLMKILYSNKIILYPLNLFVIVGFILLIEKPKKYFLIYLILFTLTQMMLVNFKDYENRYYLFLIPLIGAAVGFAFEKIAKLSRWSAVRIVFISFLILISGIDLRETYLKSKIDLNRQNDELNEVISKIKKIDTSKFEHSNIVARKPHLAFYLDMNQIYYPQTKTLGELKSFLNAKGNKMPLYVYFGTAEKRMRPQYKVLLRPSEVPEWLKLVAKSKKEAFWALYKFCPSA